LAESETRPIRIGWVSDDDEEPAYAAGHELADVPPLRIDWHRVVPDLATLGGYDLLVVDPGALRSDPVELEQRLHADLPSLPIVFYSGLRPEHHVAGGTRLAWSIPSLVHWIPQGEARLTIDLPRRLAEIAA
jgi:hypothetical protein